MGNGARICSDTGTSDGVEHADRAVVIRAIVTTVIVFMVMVGCRKRAYRVAVSPQLGVNELFDLEFAGRIGELPLVCMLLFPLVPGRIATRRDVGNKFASMIFAGNRFPGQRFGQFCGFPEDSRRSANLNADNSALVCG